MKNTTEKKTIDIEPTWIALGKICVRDEFKGELDKALEIADLVRQAQKSGKKAIEFSFPNKKEVVVVEIG